MGGIDTGGHITPMQHAQTLWDRPHEMLIRKTVSAALNDIASSISPDKRPVAFMPLAAYPQPTIVRLPDLCPKSGYCLRIHASRLSHQERIVNAKPGERSFQVTFAL